MTEKKTVIYRDATPETIETLGKLLRDGGLVAIPTETVYGLGANGLDSEAMSRIYEAKGRPSDNPLILHVPDMAAAKPLVKSLTPTAQRLMERFWPGPLTITLPKADCVPDRATGGLPRVALRCPDHDLCRAVLTAAGVPVAAPSANISGRPSPTTADAVYDDIKGRIDAILDAGTCDIGVESTVVECGDDEVTILRPGGITEQMLLEVVSKVNYDTALSSPTAVPKAPGMKYKHYAPDAPMITFVGTPEQVANAIRQEDDFTEVGLFISEETAKLLQVSPDNERCLVFGKAGDAKALAHALYSGLLHFNGTKVPRILAEGVSEAGLGRAVMNRMLKASARHVVKL